MIRFSRAERLTVYPTWLASWIGLGSGLAPGRPEESDDRAGNEAASLSLILHSSLIMGSLNQVLQEI